MSPSTGRRSRKARDVEVDGHGVGSDLDLPDSSPSRPARKRRRTQKMDDSLPATEPAKTSASHSTPFTLKHPLDDDDEPLSIEETNMIISSLATSKEPVRVATDHSNYKLEREHKDGVSAYAKFSGAEWTFYVKSLRVNIGRPPEAYRPEVPQMTSQVPRPAQSSSTPAQEEIDSEIHIDLGPSKLVSRLHVLVEYRSEPEPAWHLLVNGRNGIMINGKTYRRGEGINLRSGDVLEIGGTQMMFVTPEDPVRLHPMFRTQLKRLQRSTRRSGGGDEDDEDDGGFGGGPHAEGRGFSGGHSHGHGHAEYAPNPRSSSSQHLPTTNHRAGQSLGHGPVPLAPAPPDYKRPSTPPTGSRRSTDDADNRARPSSALRGMMVESTEEIDYSLDSAKDLKPPLSYATMIGQAIMNSDEEKLTLNNIYGWIMEKYAFYRHSQTGWQNSIRHNLSLNKAFEKIPRRTDEPGKGMKWQIVPSHRDEFTKRTARAVAKGTLRGSSAPNSPAGKEGLMSQILMSSGGPTGFGTSVSREGSPRTAPKRSPHSATPPPLSSYPVAPREAYTPDRGPRGARGSVSGGGGLGNGSNPFDDESPVPTPRSKHAMRSGFGLSDRAEGSPPMLSSSYMDESQPIITPAPRRRYPRLAPPSTAHVPSTYMPNSSPAPFWRHVYNMDTTPNRQGQLASPIKSLGTLGLPQSSSPPPMVAHRRDSGSPSKAGPARPSSVISARLPERPVERSEEPDLPSTSRELPEAETAEDDMSGGIDLTRGFQPIGSYHSNMTNAAA